MLRNARTRQHIREFILRAQRLFFRNARIFDTGVELRQLILMQCIMCRAFDRLVELRQRAIDWRRGRITRHAIRVLVLISGSKETANALAVHAERFLAVRRIRASRAVANIRHIVARPFASSRIPPDKRMLFILRRAVRIARSAVVEDMDVIRPYPAELREDTDIARIFLAAAFRAVALAADIAGIDPHARSRLTIVLELADAVYEFPRSYVVATDFLHDIFDIVFLGVVPGQVLDWLVLLLRGILVELADALPKHIVDDIIRLGIADRFRALHTPLNQAHRVRNRTFALKIRASRQENDFRLDFARVVARTVPELCRLIDENILHDKRIHLAEAVMDHREVRIGHLRILAAKVERMHRTLPGILEDGIDGIRMIAVADSTIIEAITILRRSVLAEPGLRHIDIPFAAERTISLGPFLQRRRLMRRMDKIARLHVKLDTEVRRCLYVWLPTHGDDACARDADIAFQ